MVLVKLGPYWLNADNIMAFTEHDSRPRSTMIAFVGAASLIEIRLPPEEVAQIIREAASRSAIPSEQ